MINNFDETKKRLNLAEQECAKFKDKATGVILAGSVAYSPFNNVTKESDLDLLVIVDDLKSSISDLFDSDENLSALKKRFFDGYSIKKYVEDVPVSVHVISRDSFDVISKIFVGDLRLYRKTEKTGEYILTGFDGTIYNYFIKNIPLDDVSGYRTIVPISFINKDKYFIGIHRDKLLSNPNILYEKENIVSKGIDKLWRNITSNLIDESRRVNGVVNLEKLSVLYSLSRKNKMNEDVKNLINDKTKFYINKLK